MLTGKLFSRFITREIFANPGRTTITVLGIALGVAVFLAISIANTTALLRFKQTVDDIAGRANIELVPSAGRYMDQRCLSRLRWLWQAGCRFSPIVRADVVISDESEEVVQLLGIDILAGDDFQWGIQTVGDDSSAQDDSVNSKTGGADDGNAGLTTADGVFVGHKLATDYKLKKGDALECLIDDRKVSLRILGVLGETGLGGAYSGRLLVCDISLAQAVLSIGDRISQVEMVVPEDRVEAVLSKLERDLPSGIVAERSSQRNQKVEKMTRSFEYNLWALTLIALLVGMFLIYNTMTIAVLRRRSDIGTLRAIGMCRTKVFCIVMAEALTLGTLGSFLGLALGVLMADWSLQAVAQTYQRLYFRIPLEQASIEPTTIIFAFFVGVLFTLIAALPPSIEASMVSPAEATRKQSIELKTHRYAPILAIVAMCLLGLAGYLSTLPAVDNLPLWGYLSALLCVGGFALLTPALLLGAFHSLRSIGQLIFGVEGKIAFGTMRGSLGRVAVAVASLTVGIAMMISLSIMIGSFRQTVTTWVDQTFVADLWMQPLGRASGSRNSVFDESVEKKVLAVDGVKAVEPWVEVPISFRGGRANLGGARFDVVSRFGNLKLASGKSSSEVLKDLNGHEAIVSESFALRNNLGTGSNIEVQTSEGMLPLTIIDIYYDYASDVGYIVIPRDLFVRHTGMTSYSSLSVILEPEADLEATRKLITSSLGETSLFRIKTTRELRDAVLDIFDRTFAITYALHTIAIAVAILSIINALLALTIESRKEFAMLKYLGMSAGSIRKVVLIDAGIMGLFGSLTGFVLGFVLALLLIFVINKQSFGWTVRLELPIAFMIQSFILIMVTSVASGLIPSRLVERTPAPEAIRQE